MTIMEFWMFTWGLKQNIQIQTWTTLHDIYLYHKIVKFLSNFVYKERSFMASSLCNKIWLQKKNDIKGSV